MSSLRTKAASGFQPGRWGVLTFCAAVTLAISGTLLWRADGNVEQQLERVSGAVQQIVYEGSGAEIDNLVVEPMRTDGAALEYIAGALGSQLHGRFAQATNANLIGMDSTDLLKSFPSNSKLLRRLMNAAYVLRSTLYGEEGALEMSLSLLETENGELIWHQVYSGSFAELIQQCDEVLRALQPQLAYRLETNNTVEIALSSDQHVRLQLAEQDVRTGGLDELRRAIETLETLKQEVPGYLRIRYLQWRAVDDYSMVADDSLGYDRAQMVAEMIAIDPQHRGARRAHATRLWSRRQFVASWRAFEALLDEDPSDFESAVLYADFLLQTGYVKEALQLAQSSLRLDPINVAAHIKVAEGARIAGNNPVLAQHAVLLDQIGGHSAKMFQAVLAFRAGDLEKATSLYEAFTIAVGGDSSWIRPFFDVVGTNRQAALQALEDASDEAKSFELSFIHIYAMYGFSEQALQIFLMALELDWRLPREIWAPEFAQVRALQGFADGVQSTGVTELWQLRGDPDLCKTSIEANDLVRVTCR